MRKITRSTLMTSALSVAVLGLASAPAIGSPVTSPTKGEVTVGIASTPNGVGYWEALSSGQVIAGNGAPVLGSATTGPTTGPVVAIAADPVGTGYFLVTEDGDVLAYGDARSHGSLAPSRLVSPIVAIAVTPGGRGYFLASKKGGVFAFGDARSRGSLASRHLSSPVVGIAASPGGRGYWLATADGGVFAFGSAHNYGSLLNRPARLMGLPLVGIVALPSVNGYGLIPTGDTANGGMIDDYGPSRWADNAWMTLNDAYASTGPPLGKTVAAGLIPSGQGYFMVSRSGYVFPMNNAGWIAPKGDGEWIPTAVDFNPQQQVNGPCPGCVFVEMSQVNQWIGQNVGGTAYGSPPGPMVSGLNESLETLSASSPPSISPGPSSITLFSDVVELNFNAGVPASVAYTSSDGNGDPLGGAPVVVASVPGSSCHLLPVAPASDPQGDIVINAWCAGPLKRPSVTITDWRYPVAVPSTPPTLLNPQPSEIDIVQPWIGTVNLTTSDATDMHEITAAR